jgi:hypothetical protein
LPQRTVQRNTAQRIADGEAQQGQLGRDTLQGLGGWAGTGESGGMVHLRSQRAHILCRRCRRRPGDLIDQHWPAAPQPDVLLGGMPFKSSSLISSSSATLSGREHIVQAGLHKAIMSDSLCLTLAVLPDLDQAGQSVGRLCRHLCRARQPLLQGLHAKLV